MFFKFVYSLPERRQLRGMSFGYIIYSVSSTSTFSTTATHIRKSTHFRGHVWARLWYSILETDSGSLLEPFGNQIEKNAHPQHIQTHVNKTCRKKSRGTHARRLKVTQAIALWSLKRTSPNGNWQPYKALETLHFVLQGTVKDLRWLYPGPFIGHAASHSFHEWCK